MRNLVMGVNYGLNKVRFPCPVPVGKRLRLVATLAEAAPGDGFVDITMNSVIEIEGATKPGCVVESIVRYYT